MNSRKRAVSSFRTPHLALIVSVLLTICALVMLRPSAHLAHLSALHSVSFRTTCVLAMGKQNNEGIGQTLLRNQFAVYVAELLSARLNLPEHVTAHGYNLADFFDRCGSSRDGNRTTPTVRPQCVLRRKELLFRQCERGDCACLRGETMKYIRPLAVRCDIMGVEHDGFKTLEYAGCVSNVLTRYFGGRNRWRKLYDAVHYRQGDLQEKHDEDPNRTYMIHNMVSFLCRHSDRDIVIVTQGKHELPKCGDRVVLAGNSSERDSFVIFQHAEWVGVDHSGFGIAMMQVAQPKRVMMEAYAMPWYDWLVKPEWTVFNKGGAPLSFGSGKEAIRASFGGAGLEIRTLRPGYLKKYDLFETEVPRRLWENEALPSTTDV